MINGGDKVSDFPQHFNALESKVEQLASNTKGIKNATWVTAAATVIMTMVAVITFIVEENKSRSETAQVLLRSCLSSLDMSLGVVSDQFFIDRDNNSPSVGVWACVEASENYRKTGDWNFE